MSRVLKQTKTKQGTTSSSTWTWRQIVKEYFIENEANDYITTNKSIIIVESYLGRPSGQSTQSFGGTATLKATCDGQEKSKSKTWNYGANQIAGGAWLLLNSEEFEVEHNADGTKTINVSTSLSTTAFSPNSAGANDTIDLTTIPRATASPNLDGYIESSIPISLSPASQNFKHRLYYSYNGKNGYYPSDSGFFGNTGSLDLDKSFYDYTPQATGIGNIILYTYDENGNEIGNKSGTLTVRCDKEKCKPIITATIVDVNSNTTSLTDSDTKLVKGYSHAQITYTITPRNGAIIQSKTVNGSILGDTPFVIYNISTNVFNIMAIDSRGFDTIIVKTNEMIDYVPLTLEFNAFRPTPTGSEIKVNFQGNYYNSGFGSANNTLALAWSYKSKSDNDFIDGGMFTEGVDYSINGNRFSSNGDIILSTSLFPYQENYEIALHYTDKLIYQASVKSVPKGKPALYWQDHLVGIDGDFDARDGKGTFADLKCKNLFYTPYTENNKLTHTAEYNDQYWHTGYKCYLEVGKTYTFSCETDTDDTSIYKFEVFLLKDNGYQLYYPIGNNPHTFSVAETGNYYLRVDFNNPGKTYSYWNFQIEEGTTATEFSEAKEFSNKQHYLAEEQVIGTWIDGKPLYRKVIGLGILETGTGEKTIDCGLNIASFISIKGQASGVYNNEVLLSYPIPNNSIGVRTSYNRFLLISNETGAELTDTFAILEYTKTTD